MPQLGTYSYYTGDTPIDMCMEHTESILLVYSDFKGEKEYTDKDVKYKDATLTITKNADGTYTVKALIEQEDGELIALNYTGKCTYRDRSFKGYTGPNVDKDLEFECDWLIPYDLDGTCFEIMDGGDPLPTVLHGTNVIVSPFSWPMTMARSYLVPAPSL